MFSCSYTSVMKRYKNCWTKEHNKMYQLQFVILDKIHSSVPNKWEIGITLCVYVHVVGGSE